MLVPLFAALQLLLAGPVVQMPVDDPVLPQGALVALGETKEGRFYFDPASVKSSDIAGVIRGTAVIARTGIGADDPPLLVARLWVDCGKRVYQISSGRLYTAEGREVATTPFVRDQPIPAGSAPDHMAAAWCKGGKGPAGLSTIPDYHAAL